MNDQVVLEPIFSFQALAQWFLAHNKIFATLPSDIGNSHLLQVVANIVDISRLVHSIGSVEGTGTAAHHTNSVQSLHAIPSTSTFDQASENFKNTTKLKCDN